MKFYLRTFSTIIFLFESIPIASSATVHWDDVDLLGEFRSVPEISLCETTTSSCDDPVYEGQIRVRASRDENGHLKTFDVTIDEMVLPLDIVERYGDAADFRLTEMSVRYVASYVPMRARGRVLGLSIPTIQILGLSHIDSRCEFEIREIEIVYMFETNSFEVSDWCVGAVN